LQIQNNYILANATCSNYFQSFCIKLILFQGTSVLSPIIPFGFVVVPAYTIYRKSAEHVYENHPALYILAFGMVAAKVTNKLVVCTFFHIFSSTFIFVFAQYLCCFSGCTHDQKWNAIFRQFIDWSSYAVPQSIFQFFH
jgi:hypothetical protein